MPSADPECSLGIYSVRAFSGGNRSRHVPGRRPPRPVFVVSEPLPATGRSAARTVDQAPPASFCRMDFEYFPTLSSAISAVHYLDRSFVALPRNAPTRESDGHERHRKIRRPSRQIEAAEDRNRGLRGVCRRRFGGMARRIRSARQGRENRSDDRPKASIADLTDLLARGARARDAGRELSVD